MALKQRHSHTANIGLDPVEGNQKTELAELPTLTHIPGVYSTLVFAISMGRFFNLSSQYSN